MPADPQHSDTIIKLVNDSYWEQQKPFFIDSPVARERINLEEWNRIFSDPHQRAYVLQHRVTNLIVGVAVLETAPKKEYAKFGTFAIAKAYQGKKLGQILIAYVERIARKLSKKTMIIEVFAFAKELGNYYQKLDYVFTGKTNSFFHSECIRPEYKNSTSQYIRELEKIL